MTTAHITTKLTFVLPLYSLNVGDNEVHFRHPDHVPATMDHHVAMNFKEWRSMGSPSQIFVEVHPEPDNDE